MAVSKISSFNWEKLLAKADGSDLKRSLNILRGKANEITSNHAKFASNPSPIDFESYKKKLRFTSSAVDSLEKVYASRQLPKYVAVLPEFEAKKRAAVMEIAKSTVAAANVDLQNLNKQLKDFEKFRITDLTTYKQLRNRFPQIGMEIENEINEHKWMKDAM